MVIEKLYGILLCVTVTISPIYAQTGGKEKSTGKTVTDSVTKPIKADDIPPKLLQIQDSPYSLKGLARCSALRREILELNDVLGPDVNEKVRRSKAKKRRKTASRVAGGVASSFVPFGSVIGEVSGANKKRRKYNRAVYAGTVRRGFLKGVGLKQGCKSPARP